MDEYERESLRVLFEDEFEMNVVEETIEQKSFTKSAVAIAQFEDGTWTVCNVQSLAGTITIVTSTESVGEYQSREFFDQVNSQVDINRWQSREIES